MKEKILAVILLLSVVSFVAVNTVVLNKEVKKIASSVDLLDLEDSKAKDNAEEIYANFMKKEKYISLTVSHEDLTSIENCFVEMIGHLAVDNVQDAEVTKHRLISFLEHLRRLSGFNIDAII